MCKLIINHLISAHHYYYSHHLLNFKLLSPITIITAITIIKIRSFCHPSLLLQPYLLLHTRQYYSEEQEKAISGNETLISRDTNRYRGENSRGRQYFRSNKDRQYRGRNNSKYERNFRNDNFRGIKERSIVNH